MDHPNAAIMESNTARTEDSSEGSMSTKLEYLLDASPNTIPQVADKLSCSFSDEVEPDGRFADTLPVDNGQDIPSYNSDLNSVSSMKEDESSISIKKTLKRREEQYADTLPIERTGAVCFLFFSAEFHKLPCIASSRIYVSV